MHLLLKLQQRIKNTVNTAAGTMSISSFQKDKMDHFASWSLHFYLAALSSNDDSDAESSEVVVELVSHELPFSESNECDVGLFKYQYMMLAVRVSIIFWFTWEKLNINNIADRNQLDITREIRIFY